MAGSKKSPVGRRKFLKGALAGAAASLAAPAGSLAQTGASKPPDDEATSEVEVMTEGRAGSDFMVDVIKSLGFEYIVSNPGSHLRGLHESVVNYGGNKDPEFLTCLHEESAAAMANGYAKIEGKPLCVMAYSSVGLQHAAMAVYNSYCDRAPIYMILGNRLDATLRGKRGEWAHSVQDPVAMVREFVKWDDQPVSLAHFAESAVRGYKIAMTPPMLPVAIVVDGELQENPIPDGLKLRIPKLTVATPPQGDSAAVEEAARLLVQAENPVIVVDRAARTQAGIDCLIELAETLQAPVMDQMGRMNFPSRHPLNQTARRSGLITDADVILGLELTDFWGTVNSFHDQVHRSSRPIIKPGTKLVSISTGDFYMKSNYQDQHRFCEVDVAIAGDPEATVPALIEAIKHGMTADRKAAFQARGAKFASARQKQLEQARVDATYAWNASPVSTARLSGELWAQIQSEDWSLVSEAGKVDFWPQRLWDFKKHYQFIGGAGAGGEGYNAPAALGAALANRKHGRLSVSIQCDGDLMYGPGVLWTAAHHRIPILSVMHNNRAYHQELMHMQRMCNRRNRGIDHAVVGTLITDPNIDYAQLAKSMGVYAEGPIDNPNDLAPALRRAIAVVKRGEPALLDVVTQPQ